MADIGETGGSMSGFTPNEAQEFHRLFMVGFVVFTVIAIIAHFLVWQWRPWFPSVEGYASLSDGVNAVAHNVLARLT
ncbi:MAG: light-harvesting antenna LH1, beta subunit [Lysobacterales bacterium]